MGWPLPPAVTLPPLPLLNLLANQPAQPVHACPGPWHECRLSLCPLQDGRRRLLDTAGGCPATPIPVTCKFDANGQAACDLQGKVGSILMYQGTATAAKSDGTRLSKTGNLDTVSFKYP